MKKLIAILLALVMVLSLTTTVWAVEAHTGCTGEHTGNWQALPAEGGTLFGNVNYYLTGDSVVTNTLTVTSGEVTVCLNGYALSAENGQMVFKVTQSTLNLYGGPATKEHYFKDSEDGSGLWVKSDTKVDDKHTVTGGVIYGAVNSVNGAIAVGSGRKTNSTLTMDGVTVAGSKASGYGWQGRGGGIYSEAGNMTITNSRIYGNVSTNYGGGGIYSGQDTGTVKLDNVTVAYNRARCGAGIYVQGATSVDMDNCTVQGNKSDAEGGGIFSYKSVDIQGGSFIENTSGRNGAGLHLRAASTLTSVTVQNNTAGAGTGGIYTYTDATLTNCTITKNIALTVDNAPDVWLRSGTVVIDGENSDLGHVGLSNHYEGKTSEVTIKEGSVEELFIGATNGINMTSPPKITTEAAVIIGTVRVQNANTKDETAMDISLSGTVENVIVSGNEKSDVKLTATVTDTVEISGGTTTISGAVGNVVVKEGEMENPDDPEKPLTTTPTVTVSNTATVTNMNITGGSTTIDNTATVTGTMAVSGGTTTVNGTVGSMNLTGGTTTIASTATVTNGVHVNGGEVTNNNPAVKLTYPSSGAYMPAGHTVTSPFTGVDKVYVDGALVKPENYTTYGGNIILNQKYLDGLKAGAHSVKIVYGDRQATGTFTTKGTGTVQSAKTFDAGIAVYGMMAIASAAGAVYVTGKKH